ncbi:hypothetical protein G6L66_12500 [Agrobacterium vitis]|nr:hypothetical protein [Agrobacterium vitis]
MEDEMDFKDVKYSVIKALKEGTYQHEARGTIEVKNALMTGDISREDLIKIIKRCNGTHHQRSQHHRVSTVEVHIFRRDDWYIKFYFLDPDTLFISVHK